MQLAEVFIKTGEIEDALDALNQHLDQSPSDDAARRLRIEVLLRTDDSDKHSLALTDFDQLAQLSADDYILKASLLEKCASINQAIEALAQGYNIYPDNDRLIEQYLYFLHKVGRFQEVMEIISALPTHWQWDAWAGQCYTALKQHNEAITAYSNALDGLQTHYAIDMNSEARMIEHEDISQVAGLTIMATYARFLLARAENYRQIDDLNHAKIDYQSAQVLIPNDTVIQFNLGVIAFLQGDQAEAIRLCKQALASPNALRSHMLDALKDEIYLSLRNALTD